MICSSVKTSVLYGFVKMVLTSDLVKALPFLSYTMQGHVIAVTPLLHMGVVEAPLCNQTLLPHPQLFEPSGKPQTHYLFF